MSDTGMNQATSRNAIQHQRHGTTTGDDGLKMASDSYNNDLGIIGTPIIEAGICDFLF